MASSDVDTPATHGVVLVDGLDDDVPEVTPPRANAPTPRFYAHVDPARELLDFDPLVKVGGVYVASLKTPLWVQTPPLQLASPLEDEDGEPLSHVHVVLPRGVAQFASAMEARVLAVCQQRKAEWFRRAVSDEALRTGFKEFVKPGGELKIRVPRDALVFDGNGRLTPRAGVGEGSSVRCLLELSKVCFGRTEFGAMWSLLQVQVAPQPPPPRCMIDPGAEGPVAVESRADEEVREFL